MPELVCSADDPRWLAERRAGVTATDIVTILGLSSWASPYSLYWEKLGESEPVADNDRFRLGRELEPYIAARWQETEPDLAGAHSGTDLWRSSERPWQLATPDRVVYELSPDGSKPIATGVLEVKSWADADRHSWTAGPPPAVRAQVLWQMDTMQVATGHVGVVFLPSGEFRSYTIAHADRNAPDFDSELDHCETCLDIHLMRTAGHEFHRRVLGELPAPDVDGSAATLAALRARFAGPRKDKIIPVNPQMWSDFLVCKEAVKRDELLMRHVEAEIRELMGEAGAIEVNGTIVGRRVIVDAKVSAHTRHQDYIRIIRQETDGGTDDN